MKTRLLLFLCFNTLFVYGNPPKGSIHLFQKEFINKSIDIDHIEIFFQDSIGRLWAGTYLNGVMMFDGETFTRKTPSITNNGIHCKLPINHSDYLIGTRNGLYRFDLQSLQVELVAGTQNIEVVGLYREESDKVIVFCANTILSFDLRQGSVREVIPFKYERMVMCFALSENEFVLLTDRTGLFTYRHRQREITPLQLNGVSLKNEKLLTLLHDNNFCWIGSDKGLLKYDFNTQTIMRIKELNDIEVKSLMKASDGLLWIGTNNGLYVYHLGSQAWEHYVHDNQDKRSLLSNCVWSIFEDHEGNKWLGVDGGIAFVNEKYPIRKIKWSDLIDTREGNRIIDMLHDTHGNYWLGGINGLGYCSSKSLKSSYFKVNGTDKIVNNRIRAIYEDKDGIIWVGTDGGLTWFDNRTHSFMLCNVENPTTGNNTVWTYGIVEDLQGNLYLATCSGGIFVVDKNLLLKNKGKTIHPTYNYHAESEGFKIGTQGCLGIIRDSIGNIWVNGDRQIYKIEQAGQPATIISHQTIPALPCKNTLGLFCDRQGFVWGFYQKGFYLINTENNSIEHFSAENYAKEHGEINSITECKDNIWFLTNKGAGVFNKKTSKFRHIIDFTESKYKSCYYDAQNDLIWLGGVDNCLVLNPDECLSHINNINPLAIISAMYVNDASVYDIAYRNQLSLRSNENNLAFHISFGVPIQETELQHGYYYRMAELDNSWKEFNQQTALIEYSYMRYGTYSFEIGKQHRNTGNIEVVRSLQIVIQAPWYHTVWFRLLIVMIITGLFLAGINYYRTRTKLRIAENEKANMLKLSQMKMDFLTNISHDLKTPLSLILAPANKLLGSTKNATSKELLQTILKNAMRLSAMVSQIVNFKDNDSLETTLVTVRLDIVEFVRSITLIHQEVFRAKGVELSFTSNTEKIYIKADLLKLESVMNNLISNAYKFTEKGGQVSVAINYPVSNMPSLLKLSVSDSGIGIPDEDIPHVFDRFYQSDKTLKMNKDGSGIGLFMVKNYVSQHGGEITVSSDEKGSTFTLYLPVTIGTEETQANVVAFPQVLEIDERPQQKLNILIVEDNEEIATFMVDNLVGMQCSVAHNGKAGLELAQQMLPDIIISDIMMPIMDGIEMSKQLKRNLHTSTIPIILLTAKDDIYTETSAYKLGVDAFFSKPFEIGLLTTRINQLVKTKTNLITKTIQSEQAKEDKSEIIASQDEKFLASITHLIEEHLEDPDLNVQKLAELSGYSAKQIYRRLKILTGHTAVDYIKSIRLKKAAMLLSQKKFTVAEVMYMVGFSTHSYFSKCFSEKYGKTPKVYMDEFEGI